MIWFFVIGAALVLLLIGLYGRLRWFAIADGPDGERYRRGLTQGPFVPIDDSDDARNVRHPRTHTRDEAR